MHERSTRLGRRQNKAPHRFVAKSERRRKKRASVWWGRLSRPLGFRTVADWRGRRWPRRCSLRLSPVFQPKRFLLYCTCTCRAVKLTRFSIYKYMWEYFEQTSCSLWAAVCSICKDAQLTLGSIWNALSIGSLHIFFSSHWTFKGRVWPWMMNDGGQPAARLPVWIKSVYTLSEL